MRHVQSPAAHDIIMDQLRLSRQVRTITAGGRCQGPLGNSPSVDNIHLGHNLGHLIFGNYHGIFGNFHCRSLQARKILSTRLKDGRFVDYIKIFGHSQIDTGQILFVLKSCT